MYFAFSTFSTPKLLLLYFKPDLVLSVKWSSRTLTAPILLTPLCQLGSGPVQSLFLKGNSSTSLVVSWSPPTQSNGRIQFYQLRFKFLGVPNCSWSNTSWSPPIRLQRNSTSYITEGLQPYSKYKASIWAVTELGNGKSDLAIGITTPTGNLGRNRLLYTYAPYVEDHVYTSRYISHNKFLWKSSTAVHQIRLSGYPCGSISTMFDLRSSDITLDRALHRRYMSGCDCMNMKKKGFWS